MLRIPHCLDNLHVVVEEIFASRCKTETYRVPEMKCRIPLYRTTEIKRSDFGDVVKIVKWGFPCVNGLLLTTRLQILA
jgi:hypothetical protein